MKEKEDRQDFIESAYVPSFGDGSLALVHMKGLMCTFAYLDQVTV